MAKKKPELAVEKHSQSLAGTEFEKKCVRCPGTTGKVVFGIGEERGEQLMGCSNAGPKVVLVTGAQARACNGKNPLAPSDTARASSHKPHPIFQRHRNHHL